MKEHFQLFSAPMVRAMIGRLHKARTLALFRAQTHLRVRVQTNLGFCAVFATWDLLANTVQVKGRKRTITVEKLAGKLVALKPIEAGYGTAPLRAPRIEFRDGEAD